jgi:putative chitinase
MPGKRAIDIVNAFAPKAKPEYHQAFEQGDTLLDQYSVNTPIRLAHFMAQVMHETGGLTILKENGNYSEKNLARMWDSGNWHRYFANRADCLAMGAKCTADHGEALFDLVYGNRMGNGPPASGDGWKYRGRGVLQTTGRESYRRFGQECSVDFEGDPELIIAAEHALKPALAEWQAGHLNAAADRGDIEAITRRINGGIVGLDERKAWFARIWPFVRGAAPVEHSREWQVQEKLNAGGYTYVEPDGVLGNKSKTAILDYCYRNDLPAEPGVTPELLGALGL